MLEEPHFVVAPGNVVLFSIVGSVYFMLSKVVHFAINWLKIWQNVCKFRAVTDNVSV